MKKILTAFILCAGLSTCMVANATEHKTIKQASVKAVKKAPAKPAPKKDLGDKKPTPKKR